MKVYVLTMSNRYKRPRKDLMTIVEYGTYLIDTFAAQLTGCTEKALIAVACTCFYSFSSVSQFWTH